VWLGAGALALGLGAVLTTGAGVAQADTGSGPNFTGTNDGPQTTIRTVIRATTIRSGSPSSSSESTQDSVVSRAPSPAVGDNKKGDAPDGIIVNEVVLGNGVPGLKIGPEIPLLGGGQGGGLVARIVGALARGLF
jgi:hypothetical protein